MHRIIRIIISERSPVFFCSNVTFKHPCPAFQESFSSITESGTPVTHFYQTGMRLILQPVKQQKQLELVCGVVLDQIRQVQWLGTG